MLLVTSSFLQYVYLAASHPVITSLIKPLPDDLVSLVGFGRKIKVDALYTEDEFILNVMR